MKFRIFISSVQKEFAEERRKLKAYVENDPVLSQFFELFVFELDVPPVDRRLDEVYLAELATCDAYVGFIGKEYGYRDVEGVSPTECEFNEASRLGQRRYVFVKECDSRNAREMEFLDKVSPELVWSRFTSADELKLLLGKVLAQILADRKVSFGGESYEAQECGAWDDLDEQRIRWFVRIARECRGFPLSEETPIRGILEHLGMVGESGKPRRAAMMCFGKNPQKYAVSSGVKCIEWYGTERAKPMGDYKWYKGDLFSVADEALAFIKRKMRLRVEGAKGGSQSNDVFELDEKLVREAINNAIAHRDYTSTASVQVEFFRDRLVVTNPGPMNKMMTYEKLFKPHKSYPNNPLIANALYLTKHIEDSGTGTIDMIRLCRECGVSSPEFEPLADDFTIIIQRPVFTADGKLVENNEKVAGETEKVGMQTEKSACKSEKSACKSDKSDCKDGKSDCNCDGIITEFDEFLIGKAVRKDVRRNMLEIWKLIRSDDLLTVEQLTSKATIQRTAVVTAISALKHHRLLKRVGSDKSGHWQTFFPPYDESCQT